jgi:alpha-1,2-mannosyltransferase
LPAIALGLWLAAILVIVIHVWLKPNSNTLYKVFRAGGARWLASQNLYPKVDEYIYSPFAAAFFAPMALLPDRVAGIVWRLLSLAAYAGAFAAWLRSAEISRERTALAWILLLPLSLGDFFNGQANPLVIGLLMLAVLACRRERWMIAAVCVSVAAYFKVYPLAIGLLLGVLHPRKFPLCLALALAAIFGLSLVLQRPAYVIEQYGNWIHSLGRDPRRTLNYFGTYRDFWLLLRVLRAPISTPGWALLQAASGAALAVYLYMAYRRGTPAGKLDFLLLALGACWMLLFGPATESSTYVILAPPLVLGWVYWLAQGAGAGGYLKGAVACYILLIASQMLSSWGHQYQNAYTHLIQPFGAMILAGAVIAYGWNVRPGAEPALAQRAALD